MLGTTPIELDDGTWFPGWAYGDVATIDGALIQEAIEF
jgi:hypothetical protein